MNVSRRMKTGKVNYAEPQPQQLWMSSASSKSSYCYEQLIEMIEQEIIDPSSAFIFGCDYRVPLMHGLLDKKYLEKIKMSSTTKDDSFAREYLGRFTGSTDQSWFDYEKMTKYRKILNPELKQKIEVNSDCDYLMAVDVGRYNCQTVVTIFKIYKNQENFRTKVVNIVVIGAGETNRHFQTQALEIKRLITAYDPVEIVIDGNGLGAGLMDFMTIPTVGEQTVYPAYCAFNDSDYDKKTYPDAIPLIYDLKSNATLDGKIHANCYTMINSGRVLFLAREQEVKNRLIGTKVGQKMRSDERARRLMPHEITTRLFEEMGNLRLKQSAGIELKLEQINTHMGKDKFSSLEYGLWRIKEREDEYYKKVRRKSRNRERKLTFFTNRG